MGACDPTVCRIRICREYISPELAQKHLERLWAAERRLVPRLFGAILEIEGEGTAQTATPTSSAEMFFLQALPVSPARFRPASKMGQQIFENTRSVKLTDVLKACQSIRDFQANGGARNAAGPRLDNDDFNTKLLPIWNNLQLCVNVVVDAGLDTRAGAEPVGGVKQVLEKKEGLFRMHMMGKRVNYACRSVISPDPMIETDEVGIPSVFGTKLTYPEPATDRNFYKMRDAVINGPDVHPGATHIEDEYGVVKKLSADKSKRTAQAKQLLTCLSNTGRKKKNPTKIVHRHIRNGDYVLVNRQPTLHKASLMAHKARILQGERTIRLHYANCKTYNADFDGDEMNVHFPQNEMARAEAEHIALSHHQYISLGGSPLSGLIQDHVVSGVRMICKDAMYTRRDYQQLVYGAVGDGFGKVDILPPAMIKPIRMWTGKQIISTIMHNLTKGFTGLNLTSKTQTNNHWSSPLKGPLVSDKIPKGAFQKEGVLLEGESTVIFSGGLMLSGLLDKKQIGSAKNGLIHAVQEVYGNTYSGRLLSMLGRLFTVMVKFNAHTFGIEDVLLTPAAEAERRALIVKGDNIGPAEVAKYTKSESTDPATISKNIETIFRDEKEMKGLDAVMMTAGNDMQSAIVKATCPGGLAKPFPANHLQAMVQTGAKGSTVNATQISSLLGQQALEGKRVPVMVSGKTLPSFRPFDPSGRAGGLILGRFLTGINPAEYYFHCMAGREGLVDTAVKTSRSGYLQRCLIKHMEDLTVGYDMTVRDADGSVMQFLYGEDGLDVSKTSQLTNFALMRDNYTALLDRFGAANLEALFPGKFASKGRSALKKACKNPAEYPPALSKYRPDRYFGAVSETLNGDLDKFAATLETGNVTAKKMKELMFLKSFRSLAEPGEAVGVLAAQAIGEPSTQMTLNTFHFAGRSDMNVTLGIPRLREVLMTASAQIKTPIISVQLGNDHKAAAKLAGRLRRVTLGNLLQKVTVAEQLVAETGGWRSRRYEITLDFIPQAEYEKGFSIDQSAAMQGVEKFLRTQLSDLVKKYGSKPVGGSGVGVVVQAPKATEEGEGAETVPDAPAAAKPDSDGESSSDDDDDDDDDMADAATKRKAKTEGYGKDKSQEDDADSVDEVDSDDYDSDSEDAAAANDDEVDSDVEMTKPTKKKSTATPEQKAAAKATTDSQRKKYVLEGDFKIKDYIFDDTVGQCTVTMQYPAEDPVIFWVSLFERAAEDIVIRAVPGIELCALTKSKQSLAEPDMLAISGTNLKELWNYPDLVDLTKLRSNDVHAMMSTYGVEAARATIVNQVNEVFGVYGIVVDPRHMSLVADTMTYDGGYRAMNRMGLRTSTSPFLKMSFETTFDFLRTASLHGEHDPLQSSSAQLVLGQPTHGGTGAFSLQQQLVE